VGHTPAAAAAVRVRLVLLPQTLQLEVQVEQDSVAPSQAQEFFTQAVAAVHLAKPAHRLTPVLAVAAVAARAGHTATLTQFNIRVLLELLTQVVVGVGVLQALAALQIQAVAQAVLVLLSFATHKSIQPPR